MTPEIDAGSQRGRLGTGEVCTQEFCGYVDPGQKSHRENTLYLHGSWKQYDEFVEYQGQPGDGYLTLIFTGGEVNAVIEQGSAEVLVDNEPLTKNRGADIVVKGGKTVVTAAKPDMYTIVSGKHYIHELKLIPEKGFKLFAFTFG